MKFGESLSDGLVPEWKAQYVDYKAGKKLIKKVDALRASFHEFNNITSEQAPTSIGSLKVPGNKHNASLNDRTPLLGPIAEVSPLEIDPVDVSQNNNANTSATTATGHSINSSTSNINPSKPPTQISERPQHSANKLPIPVEVPGLKRRNSIFNYSLRSSNKDKQQSDFDAGKTAFTEWADEELLKVDKFYLEKELEAYERFLILQDQLYQLREHKQEVIKARLDAAANTHKNGALSKISNPDKIYGVNDLAKHTKGFLEALNRFETPSLPSTTFLKKWKWKKNKGKIGNDISMQKTEHGDFDDFAFDPSFEQNRIRNGQEYLTREDEVDDDNSVDLTSIDSQRSAHNSPSTDAHKNSAAGPVGGSVEARTSLDSLASNMAALEATRRNARRDYVKKQKTPFRVPYLYARKQLRTALLEHYRALTLLKSFRVLNRTALRKITKKFDKSSGTSINEGFMKKVDHTYCQTSDLIDKLIRQVEELYIIFFDPESIDRKHSLEKLKSIAYTMNSVEIRQPGYYASTFFSGTTLGFGIPLGILGLYVGLHKTITGELPEGKFMLQIWAGFFLLNFTLILFGINLMVFDHFKINYKFIFEFDLGTTLNYKQFFLLPNMAFSLLAILFWFSFNNFWPAQFPGRDWPWIYFGVVLAIFLWPGKQFYGSSRRWLQIALWRLILSGFYPVEFRDFFLGDIFCSLTYTMGNLSFFFCLYAHHWNGLLNGGKSSDNVCGSSKSRLMGFFSTLPSIWRFLQCIRRYTDSGDWFPHLANMAKYGISALYYVLLSIYRIDQNETHRVTFIVFATINSLYTSAWDILMDWSLLQSDSKYFLLRNNIFFKNPYYYYTAMILDVILRFQWIFYACFSEQIQQSAVTSFFVALAEILRRFIWIFFRMENEHCTNVTLFRASRDSPIPYKVKHKVEKAIKKLVRLRYESNKERTDDALLSDQRPIILGGPESYASTTGAASKSRRYDEESDLGLGKHGATDASYVQPGDSSQYKQGGAGTTIGSLSGASGAKLRRKSTFMTFTSALNTAHIKDFQRRKTQLQLAHDSDDDEEDEFSDVGSSSGSKK